MSKFSINRFSALNYQKLLNNKNSSKTNKTNDTNVSNNQNTKKTDNVRDTFTCIYPPCPDDVKDIVNNEKNDLKDTFTCIYPPCPDDVKDLINNETEEKDLTDTFTCIIPPVPDETKDIITGNKINISGMHKERPVPGSPADDGTYYNKGKFKPFNA